MRNRSSGQILPVVILSMVVLTIIIFGLVQWSQNDSKWAVKQQKSTFASSMAEAGIDRGIWKLQSSTFTWATAYANTTISGYDFNTTYSDVSSGTYRIKFSSGPGVNQVTIWAEGRDQNKRELRSIQEVVQNVAVPGAIISGGALTDSGLAIVHWGGEMSMGNLTVSGASLTHHYPRKLSAQTVLPYDGNGLTPPNTDNQEWWSGYPIPQLPILDFAALRSSAAASGTLNCNGDGNPSMANPVCAPLSACMLTPHPANASTQVIPCGSACVNCTVNHFFQDPRYNDNDVWYWDNNVTINDPGTRGIIAVRGNMTTQYGDWYGPYGPMNANVTVHVPTNAWMEYQKMDTGGANDYPADTGLHQNASTYVIGSCGSGCEGSLTGDDLGFYGFVYVGGNVNFAGDADIYGAVWVVGSWSAAGNNVIFYNDLMQLPTVNVTLVKQSWKEVPPSTQAWN